MVRGSVAEWLKAHDSKSCGQQCLGGSNPLASAKQCLASATRPNGRALPPNLWYINSVWEHIIFLGFSRRTGRGDLYEAFSKKWKSC